MHEMSTPDVVESGVILQSIRNNLPEPRKVSNAFHDQIQDVPDNLHTLMTMQFGQFLDHDLTFTPEVEAEPNEPLCCDEPLVKSIYNFFFSLL